MFDQKGQYRREKCLIRQREFAVSTGLMQGKFAISVRLLQGQYMRGKCLIRRVSTGERSV